MSKDMDIRKSSRLIIVDKKGRLLLFLYQDEHQGPFWATAGGELKEGESYLEAAKRELYEETGLRLKIDVLLKERDEIYPVARSSPARWLEKYYLVSCPENSEIYAAQWTDEEKSTIQEWKWWSFDEMVEEGGDSFKPNWLADLLHSVIESTENA